jgi:hypothetical protein
MVTVVGSPPTPEQAHHHHGHPGRCRSNNKPGVIIVVPAPNDDDNAVAVMTIASAMSRNAALPSSIWMAMRHTSLADANPSSLPWPSSCFPPLRGVFLIVVVSPSLLLSPSQLLLHRVMIQFDHPPGPPASNAHCFLGLRHGPSHPSAHLVVPVYFPPSEGSSLSWSSSPFVVVVVVVVALHCNPIQSSPRSHHIQCTLFSAILMLSKLSPCPSGGTLCCCLISPAHRAPQPCAQINYYCPWAARINLLLLPTTMMANDIVLLPIPSLSSHAIVSCPSTAIAGASTLSIWLGTSSTQ